MDEVRKMQVTEVERVKMANMQAKNELRDFYEY